MTKPNYYAVLPAEVRYAKIPAQAKLLFCEITALSNATGYCWATNSYFAELYGMTKENISRLLAKLEKAGFIECSYKYNDNDKTYRKILIKISIDKNDEALANKVGIDKNINRQKCQGGIDKNVKGVLIKKSNIILKENNTSRIKEEEVYRFTFPCNEKTIKKGRPKVVETTYGLTDDLIKDYKETYPQVNVESELKKMKRWLIDNGLKSKKGMPRFINGWLNRCKPEKANTNDLKDKAREAYIKDVEMRLGKDKEKSAQQRDKDNLRFLEAQLVNLANENEGVKNDSDRDSKLITSNKDGPTVVPDTRET